MEKCVLGIGLSPFGSLHDLKPFTDFSEHLLAAQTGQ
jgi:hypothetical protein